MDSDTDEISVQTSEDKANLLDSIKNIVVDVISNLDDLQYHDYKFEENFKSEVYQSFQNINNEDLDKYYQEIIDTLSVSEGRGKYGDHINII